MAYDFDSLVYWLWPSVAPIYLFRKRGVHAFGPIGLFVLLQVGGFVFAAVMTYPQSAAHFHAHMR
jgi:hypothetical protein